MPVDPWAIDGLSLSGLEARTSDAALIMSDGTALGSRSGVRPGDPGLTVSLAGSTINVSAGVAVVAYSGQGVYRAAFPSGVSPGTLTAAHATLPRIDLVYLRVWDNSVDSSGLNKADIVYLAGTAAASPVAPTPAGTQIYMPLATVNVPFSGNGSPTVSTAVRPTTVAPGGILPSTTAPSTPYNGQYWDDGTSLRRWNGSAWRTVSPLTPQITAQVNQPPTSPLSTFTDFVTGDWPAATVVVPPSGMVRITIGGAVGNTDSTTAAAWLGWKAAGAFSETTSEANSVSAVGGRTYASRTVVRTGLTPGASLTITPQWWSNTAGAGRRISNGQLIVEPMPG
ncbi:hypothetical protein [Streptomyces sp. NPDC058291]|uniref:hypothetical protein n=1 Tax=Streptomyces sp. NPDC058291 TaxID=3346427 RepID=UPI0036EDCDF2